MTVRVAVLISGRGSNMASLVEAAREPDYPARIALVLSNKPGAGGLETASEAGIATAVVRLRDFPDRAECDAEIDRFLREHRIDLVCLAGFMRILTPGFVQAWEGRMLNIHPSLLPKYKGLDTHARALAAGDAEHGCTVHFVVPELDSGPIVAQSRVPILPGDDPDSLAARVLAAEHALYPQALAQVARGEVRLTEA
ncbi:phosphoribosylglycinamide formyltransferase [Enterovirga rhinocerotis]|uniref:Phosphoribosylglycinamide formyltransferase n=1 Tax=Enterovirga rhinocerotis TaxID=1339210 RepID=A0A4R7C8E6_9HYPH|nr:phosphoribosylglycinamide formyltransferase [Enterovirga rhinocerotis]TDR94904.1 phosphoribosylglycinamide formyltransferase-1 [Enterovirga rhinocerotis]